MYIDDHGGTSNAKANWYPSVPYGSAGSGSVCTPFILGYTFDAWRGPISNVGVTQSYIIFTPDDYDGNYGYSISGIEGKYLILCLSILFRVNSIM